MTAEHKARVRCEGWTRRGGAFTFGTPEWSQCENDAVVTLTVEQKGETTDQPACVGCWENAKKSGITILKAEPLHVTEPAEVEGT